MDAKGKGHIFLYIAFVNAPQSVVGWEQDSIFCLLSIVQKWDTHWLFGFVSSTELNNCGSELCRLIRECGFLCQDTLKL